MADLQYITLSRIEGHNPHFWPLLKWGEVLVEYDLVVMGVYYPVYQTIVCKEMHNGALRDTVQEVVDVNKKQQRPQNCALGNTRCNSGPRGIHSVNSNSHLPVTEEGRRDLAFTPLLKDDGEPWERFSESRLNSLAGVVTWNQALNSGHPSKYWPCWMTA